MGRGTEARASSRPAVLAVVATFAILATLAGTATATASWPGRDGVIAFVGADFPEYRPEPLRNGIWIGEPNGEPRRLTEDAGDQSPAFSPDGRWIVFSRGSGPVNSEGIYPKRAIFLIGVDGSGLTQVTDGSAEDRDPSFTADGRRILFARSPAGGREGDDIYSVGIGGSGLRRLTTGTATERRPVASPNGRVVAFDRRRGQRTRVFTMRPNGTRFNNATSRLPRHDDALEPEFSPSGRRIAYTRVHNDRPRLFLIRPNGRKPRPLPSTRQCSGCPIFLSPTFSPDGRSLLAVAARNFRYFLVRTLLRNPRRAHPLPKGFGTRQDTIEPVWQALPR